MKISFKCPKCGCNEIEEIMGGVVVASEVKEDACYLGDGEIELEYGEQTNTDGEVERYQCKNCGFLISDTNTVLLCFLIDNDMIELSDEERAMIKEDLESRIFGSYRTSICS